jgi:electron transport complex protein RnfE
MNNATDKTTRREIFWLGVFRQNPTFVIMLGLCSTLAVTVSLENSLGMGLATLFVLVTSNLLISSLRNLIPDKVRMPIFVVVIASSVTIISMFMEAHTPSLFQRLGIYVPLIVVNCIIMGRAEAFAYKNSVIDSIVDGAAMGLGFTLALSLIGIIRQLLGTGKFTFLGHTIFNTHTPVINMMILPPGAYLVMGLLLAIFKKVGSRKRGA